MSSAKVAGFEIEYETYGLPANPAVFMVHGLYFDHYSMEALAERLTDAYFVVAHDAIGHGRSSKPDEFSLTDQADVLNGLIDKLGCRRVAVLGEAMGSYIAMKAAFLDPRRIVKLILLAPKARGKTSSMVEYFQIRGIDESAMTTEEKIAALSDAIWCPETLPERRRQIIHDMLPGMQLSRSEAGVAAASLSDFDLTEELPLIQAETVVFTGRYDGLNPPAKGREVAAGILGGRFELFEHSGHLLKYEEQVKTGDELRLFLDG
jgi:3-oxoadipate enol-lactonase